MLKSVLTLLSLDPMTYSLISLKSVVLSLTCSLASADILDAGLCTFISPSMVTACGKAFKHR